MLGEEDHISERISTSVYIAPHVLTSVEPEVSAQLAARLAGYADPVFCGVFFVRADGSFDFEVTELTGSRLVDDLCVGAARRWTFTPGTKDGEPVDSYLRVRMEFGDD